MNDKDGKVPATASLSDEERDRLAREEEAELQRILKEKGLKVTRAYVRDPESDKERSKVAARVARFRSGQKAKGLVPTAAPAAVVAAVKKAGGWTQWQAGLQVPPAQPGTPPAGAGAVQRPQELSEDDRRDLDLGRRVRGLAGWRGRAIRWLVSF